jgi:hypothetical protein
MSDQQQRLSNKHRVRRTLAVVVAGAVLGVGGASALATEDRPATPSTACAVTENDLLRAADAAGRLESAHPELFERSPRPADYDDLRLAAEWARRMGCGSGQ